MESKTSYYDDDTYHMNPTTGGGNYDEAELWKQSQNQDLNQNTGDDVLAAATIDRTFVPTLFNDENQDYSVSNPQMQGSHISYFVKGVDKQGPWEGQRRYSHFHVLHETLMLRWPGVYIPKVPPKKAIVSQNIQIISCVQGGKEIKFIHERRFYLERFLRKCALYDFIINSEEFLMFSRPNGDIEKNLGKLSRLPTATAIDRLEQSLDVKQRNFDLTEKEQFNNTIIEFSYFAKKVVPQLKVMKKMIKNFQQIKTSNIANHKGFYNILSNYEEVNLNVYVEHDKQRMVLGHESKDKEYKEQVDNLIQNLNNPFVDMYHWCKGETYDLQALVDAVLIREQVEKQQKKYEEKKKNAQTDLENVNQGKKTVRTILKNSKDATGLQSSLENVEKEIENLQKMHEIITIYLGHQVIPRFRKDKHQIYCKLMQQFNSMEIGNAYQVASFWNGIVQNPNVKTAVASK